MVTYDPPLKARPAKRDSDLTEQASTVTMSPEPVDVVFANPAPHTTSEAIRKVALTAAATTHAAATPVEIIAVAAVFETYLRHGESPDVDEGGSGR